VVVDRGVLHAPGVDGGFGVGEGVTYGSVKASTALVESCEVDDLVGQERCACAGGHGENGCDPGA